MALVVKDRVQQTSTTTSTGTYTLNGSVTGYQDFSVIGNGNTTYYAATNGTDWEVGIGTYTASGTTLSRDTILASSNSNNAVNWAAGTKSVFVTYPAGKSIYQDASGNTFVPNLGASTASSAAVTTLSASGVATFSAGTAAAPAITTSGDTNNGIFFPAADVTAITTAGSERLRVNSSGNVGIGTTSATGLRLNVVGAAGAYAAQFYVNTGGAVTTGLDSYSLAIGGNISNGGAEVNIVYGSAGGGLAFNSFNGTTITERVRFDASGNVGIGTSSALGVLHTSISGAPNYFYLDAYGNGVNIVGGRTNGTSGAPTALSANNSILTLGARGYDGTAFTSTVKAFIGMYASENWSATAQGTYITFNTTAAGTTTRSEVMRIDGSGNVGIGTSSPGAKVDVVGQIAASYNNTTGVVNTAAQALGTNTVSMVLISADTTLTSTVPAAGARATVIIKTSGTTTRTVTFGTGFKSQGTLATGATADRFWVVNFISDGTSLYETGRTTTAYA